MMQKNLFLDEAVMVLQQCETVLVINLICGMDAQASKSLCAKFNWAAQLYEQFGRLSGLPYYRCIGIQGEQ